MKHLIFFLLAIPFVLGCCCPSPPGSYDADKYSNNNSTWDAPQKSDAIAEPTSPQRKKELAKAKVAEEKKKVADGKEKKARISSLKAKTRKKYVKFDDITWYEHKSEPKYLNTRSFIAVYFHVDSKGSAQNLRIKNVFTADTWLFIESYEIKTDAQTYEIEKGSYGVERDNNADIWEWYDDPVDGKAMAMLRDISTSKSVMIRYKGRQYHHDRTLGAAEKKAIAEMLELYALLDG